MCRFLSNKCTSRIHTKVIRPNFSLALLVKCIFIFLIGECFDIGNFLDYESSSSYYNFTENPNKPSDTVAGDSDKPLDNVSINSSNSGDDDDDDDSKRNVNSNRNTESTDNKPSDDKLSEKKAGKRKAVDFEENIQNQEVKKALLESIKDKEQRDLEIAIANSMEDTKHDPYAPSSSKSTYNPSSSRMNYDPSASKPTFYEHDYLDDNDFLSEEDSSSTYSSLNDEDVRVKEGESTPERLLREARANKKLDIQEIEDNLPKRK